MKIKNIISIYQKKYLIVSMMNLIIDIPPTVKNLPMWQ